jgi:hypothetical protein
LAKKVCDALEEYPCLVTALLDNRFCFVFAAFPDFSENETVKSIATKILEELKAKKKGEKKNKKKGKKNKEQKITTEHLVGGLIILRRKHLEALLTPTLKDRYHFFKPEVDEQK